MKKIINNLVQQDLYEILRLNPDSFSWDENKETGLFELEVKNSKTVTTIYPYKSEDVLRKDVESLFNAMGKEWE